MNKLHGNLQTNVSVVHSKLHEFQEKLATAPLNKVLVAEELLSARALEQAILEEESLLLQK